MLWALVCSALAVCSVQALLFNQRAYCGTGHNYLTQNNGVINSHAGISQNHTYGRNMDCIWTIEAPEGMMVELVAQSFDLESNPTCDNDYLMLYDSNDTSASTVSLGKFCGKGFIPISSTGRFLTLRFVTNGNTQKSGFQMFYNFTSTRVHICQEDYFVCTNGKCIYPDYWCDGADDCGDDSDEVNCTVCGYNEFDCNTTRGCIPNRRLCDGNNDCGNNLDETQGNCQAIRHDCNVDEYDCSTGKGCIPISYLCDQWDDCGNAEDEHEPTCMAYFQGSRCGATNQTGTSGTIESPGYPHMYDDNIRCFFLIQAPVGTKSCKGYLCVNHIASILSRKKPGSDFNIQSLSFKFDQQFHLDEQELNLESATRCYRHDYVFIFAYIGIYSHGPFCGTTAPANFTIPVHSAFVEFKTDSSNHSIGFRLDWHANS